MGYHTLGVNYYCALSYVWYLTLMVEREKRYRAKRRTNGATQIAVWLEPDQQQTLAFLMSFWGLSKSNALRHALVVAERALDDR